MVELRCSVSEDILKSNYEINKNRKLPSLSKLKNSPHKLTTEVDICAAGPSIRGFEDRLKSSKNDVFSVKTVNYLTNLGIDPRYAVTIDPKEDKGRVQLNKKTNYIVSSQCNPSLFDALEGYKTYIIDAIITKNWCPSDKCVSAGSNSTIHAILLAVWLGYKRLNLYGFDCGYSSDREDYRVNRENVYDDTKDHMLISCPDTGKIYRTTTEYIGMAEEAMKIMQILSRTHNVKFTVYGDTTLSCILKHNLDKQKYEINKDFPVRWLKAA